MNYNEIKSNYPKAFEALVIYNTECTEYSASVHKDGGLMFYDGSLRDTYFMEDHRLYNFFDYNEILIFIKPKGFKRFGYDIHHKVKLPKRDHWVDTLTGYKENRQEAEEAAFIKSFEIMENKLRIKL